MADNPQRDGLKKADVAVVTGGAMGLGRGIALRLAAVVSFLISSDSGYMTGQAVACNGGSVMIS